VGALTLQVAGLISSFHDTLLPVVYSVKMLSARAEKGAKSTVFNAVLSTCI
jgi:hypothetical protein